MRTFNMPIYSYSKDTKIGIVFEKNGLLFPLLFCF